MKYGADMFLNDFFYAYSERDSWRYDRIINYRKGARKISTGTANH